MPRRNRGQMSVEEAGRKGGRKGGRTTKKRYGKVFYSEIGTKGGHRVRDLIREGKEMESSRTPMEEDMYELDD